MMARSSAYTPNLPARYSGETAEESFLRTGLLCVSFGEFQRWVTAVGAASRAVFCADADRAFCREMDLTGRCIVKNEKHR